MVAEFLSSTIFGAGICFGKSIWVPPTPTTSVVIVNIPPVMFILTLSRFAIVPDWARKIPEAVIAKACAAQQYGQNDLIATYCIPMNQMPAPMAPNAQRVRVFNERIYFFWLEEIFLFLIPNVFSKKTT